MFENQALVPLSCWNSRAKINRIEIRWSVIRGWRQRRRRIIIVPSFYLSLSLYLTLKTSAEGFLGFSSDREKIPTCAPSKTLLGNWRNLLLLLPACVRSSDSLFPANGNEIKRDGVHSGASRSANMRRDLGVLSKVILSCVRIVYLAIAVIFVFPEAISGRLCTSF